MTMANHNCLSLSALAAASSMLAIIAPAQAQSVCSATVTAVLCTNGGATTTLDGTAVLGIAPTVTEGLVVTSVAPLSLAINGTLNTTNSLALDAQSAGDLAITAGTGGAVNLVTTGTGPGATLIANGSLAAVVGSANTTGGWSLLGFGGTGANVTTGAVTATNLAVSPFFTLFGSPLAGAVLVGSSTGPATLTVNGNLSATGALPTASLVGAVTLASAPTGAASTTVNGTVTVTNTGDAAGAAAVGGGSATVNVTGAVLVNGTTSATGLAALGTNDGVTLSGTATVTAGANVTARAQEDATGIFATGTTVTITAPNATISATDTDISGSVNDAIGVEGRAVNGLTINVGQVVSSGEGIIADTSGGTSAALNVTVKGVQAATTGVTATGLGATPITVNATAPIVASGGLGINASGVDGLVTITEVGVNGSAGGVLATTSGTGAVVVNANGGTTTSAGGDAIRIVSGGAATTNVAAGAIVTGQGAFDAIDSTAATTNTVNIAGTINTTGTGAALRATGGPATVNVQSGGRLSGGLVLTGGNDTVNIQSGGTFGPSGTVDFGTGTDTLNVRSGGALQLAAGTPFTGLEVFNNAGALGLGAGSVSLAGLTTFTNTGMLSATNGTTAITGLATFTNAGAITMVDGQTNDVLTLGTPAAPTNFVGAAGSRLAVDVSPTAADQLVITGNASGTTVIAPSFVGGMVYNPTGVTVVTTSGTVASGAFVIDPAVASQGFVNLGVTQTGGITRVTTDIDRSVGELASVREFNQDMWYQSFDAYDDAVRGRHAGSLTTGNPVGVWGQLYRSRDRHDANGTLVTGGSNLAFGNELEVDRGGAQVGLEYRGPGFVIGATGGFEWADNRDSPTGSVITGQGHNWGAYALAGMSNGLYAGVLYKRDELDLRFFNPGRGVAAYFNDAHSEGVDGQIGLKGTAGTIGFDLQGGLSYVKTVTGNYQAQNLDMSWDSSRSLRGRLGARAFFPQLWGAYLGAKVIHEFKDPAVFRIADATTGLSAGEFVSAKRGTWARLEAGIDSLGIKGAMVSVWGDVGNTKSIGARVGFRF